MSEVQYRDISGFPGYRVGDDGSVWSCLKRKGITGGGSRFVIGKNWTELTPRKTNAGYWRVTLYRQKIRHELTVHRLVLEAFVGPCPKGKECGHENGNASDNRLENLSWKTPSENQKDRARHGRKNIGQGRYGRKTTPEQVVEIQALRGKLPITAIAERFGIKRGSVDYWHRKARESAMSVSD